MTNKELREYLERFKDEEEVSFVIADPKSRKAYGPEEVFVIFNENISNPCICIGVGQSCGNTADWNCTAIWKNRTTASGKKTVFRR